ncbi:MAG TPA: hypothetical protein VHX65_00415 [Pirellulales bacterium]|nr:hypothetical protein [Pirellulales bacterium]
MATAFRFRWLSGITLALALAAGATRLSAADPAPGNPGSENAPATSSSASDVNLFDLMRDGDLGVQFIPKNSREATLILTNNTDKPLNVHLPDAFAAMPVLAQFQGANNAGGNNRTTGTNNNNNNNKNQSVGTGTNNNQQRQGGFGGAVANAQAAAQGNAQAGGGAGGAAFSIPPERVVKLKLPTVCLEYGKAEPNSHVPYTIVPVEKYTSSPEVQEICRLLGTGKVDQQTAQAAAWHLANHLSWDKLADMKHFPHTGFTRPVFSQDQIRAAMALTDKAIKMADARPAATPADQKSAASPATSSASPAPAAAGAKTAG